jgi:hypothetical protein
MGIDEMEATISDKTSSGSDTRGWTGMGKVTTKTQGVTQVRSRTGYTQINGYPKEVALHRQMLRQAPGRKPTTDDGNQAYHSVVLCTSWGIDGVDYFSPL